MSKPSIRRVGVLMVVVFLLSAVLVPAAAAAPASNGAASVSQGASSCPIYYRVVAGDNLTKIAYRYGVTIYQIMQWNHISNPDRIYVGQVLMIRPWNCNPYKPPAPPAPKPPPLPGPCSGGCAPAPGDVWHATYYNSTDLSGPIVFQRDEKRPCWNCGTGAPAPNVGADNFSIRWTNTSNATGGTYRVTVRTDDGARVYVDGVKILDAWQVQSVRGYFVDIVIAPGNHTWTLEYFEATGLAEFCFTVQKL